MADKVEFEGWWEAVDSSPSPSPDVSGKAEVDRWSDGRVVASFLARKLEVPDGEMVEVVSDGEVVLSATVEGGQARGRVDSEDGGRVPDLADKPVELRHGDVVLARTVVAPE